jgi:hypothetical protein
MCAIASVVSCVVDGEDGNGELSSDDSAAGSSAGGRCSLIVPSRCPALTNWIGRSRSFLPDEKAAVRWDDCQRASSLSENLGPAAASISKPIHREVKAGHANIPSCTGGHDWDDWRLLEERCGVPFAEPLPLLLPFLRDMGSIAWNRACIEERCCSGCASEETTASACGERKA